MTLPKDTLSGTEQKDVGASRGLGAADLERLIERVRQKDWKWLREAAHEGSGMYPGTHWDFCPSAFARLEKLGLVSLYMPHNAVHKYRAVTTARGSEALAAYAEHLTAPTRRPSHSPDVKDTQ